jgi:hypothetical protein
LFFYLVKNIGKRSFSVYDVEGYRKYLNPVMAVSVFTAVESIK